MPKTRQNVPDFPTAGILLWTYNAWDTIVGSAETEGLLLERLPRLDDGCDGQQ